MKKSQAIAKIKDKIMSLNYNRKYLAPHTEEAIDPNKWYEFEAMDILKTIESLGMVPPMIKEKSFTMLESGELTYAVHEWEPE